MPGQVERPRQLLLDAVGDARGIARDFEVVEQNGEFVSAEARDHVAGTEADFQPPRDLDNQLIPHQVSEAVVDDLETIKVEKEDGKMIVVTLFRAPKRTLQPIH